MPPGLLPNLDFFIAWDYLWFLFKNISPYFWAAMGIGLCVGLSILGAAWCVQLHGKSWTIASSIGCQDVNAGGAVQGHLHYRQQFVRSSHSRATHHLKELDQVSLAYWLPMHAWHAEVCAWMTSSGRGIHRKRNTLCSSGSAALSLSIYESLQHHKITCLVLCSTLAVPMQSFPCPQVTFSAAEVNSSQRTLDDARPAWIASTTSTRIADHLAALFASFVEHGP